MITLINGKLVNNRDASISTFDHGFLYGDGFYDTMKTYDGKVFELPLHLQRIASSAQRMDITLPWSLSQLQEWILEFAQANRLRDARVRVTITRGTNDFDFATSKSPTLVIHGEEHKTDPSLYENGISVWTMEHQRILPEVKHLARTGLFLASKLAREKCVDEIVFVGAGGMVLEASIANIFIVNNDALKTPSTGILHGLTRARTIQLAQDLGYHVSEEEVHVSELTTADEIFLTNRLREIMPVVRVNGQPVGNGRPGNITMSLAATYKNYALDRMAPSARSVWSSAASVRTGDSRRKS